MPLVKGTTVLTPLIDIYFYNALVFFYFVWIEAMNTMAATKSYFRVILWV